MLAYVFFEAYGVNIYRTLPFLVCQLSCIFSPFQYISHLKLEVVSVIFVFKGVKKIYLYSDLYRVCILLLQVKDTVQVDQNVSRHLSHELSRDDWDFLVSLN